MGFIFWFVSTVPIKIVQSNIFPQAIGVEIGKFFMLKCFSATRLTWTLPPGTATITSIVGYKLLVVKATERHTGKYRCQGFYESGKIFNSTAEVYVARE